jgi:hypothetical protein
MSDRGRRIRTGFPVAAEHVEAAIVIGVNLAEEHRSLVEPAAVERADAAEPVKDRGPGSTTSAVRSGCVALRSTPTNLLPAALRFTRCAVQLIAPSLPVTSRAEISACCSSRSHSKTRNRAACRSNAPSSR